MAIFLSLKELPKQVNFINTGTLNLENDFKYLDIYREIKISDKYNLSINKKYLTISPEFYFKYKDNYKLDLLIFSKEKFNSNLINLIYYIKINNLNKLCYKKKFFKEFLLATKKKIPNFKIKFLNFMLKMLYKINFNVYLKKRKFFKLDLPIVYFRENIYKGYIVGDFDYNIYIEKTKKFILESEFVLKNLSDDISKKIYKDLIFSKPSVQWKNYYNMIFDETHYMHYLNFNNANIINLGVDNGFEIPFFLSKKIKKIINVDPTGEEYLEDYVRIFTEQFKEKLEFEKSYLYKSDNVYKASNKSLKKITLEEILKKYSIEKDIIIKSDIEGAEIEMVDELEKIAHVTRPQIAISIYHLDSSLEPINSQITLIPKRLISFLKDYNFYVKHYTYNQTETVFYCIPKEKINLSN